MDVHGRMVKAVKLLSELKRTNWAVLDIMHCNKEIMKWKSNVQKCGKEWQISKMNEEEGEIKVTWLLWYSRQWRWRLKINKLNLYWKWRRTKMK